MTIEPPPAGMLYGPTEIDDDEPGAVLVTTVAGVGVGVCRLYRATALAHPTVALYVTCTSPDDPDSGPVDSQASRAYPLSGSVIYAPLTCESATPPTVIPVIVEPAFGTHWTATTTLEFPEPYPKAPSSTVV